MDVNADRTKYMVLSVAWDKSRTPVLQVGCRAQAPDRPEGYPSTEPEMTTTLRFRAVY